MVELESLAVSLTKNGYMKLATVVQAHPSSETLDHVSGTHRGVNLVRSQAASILCADPATGIVPEFWDRIRRYDFSLIQAYVFVAVIFAHHRLIRQFLNAGRGSATGTIMRTDMTEKEYTNLQFAMATIGLCSYERGADQVSYDMTPLMQQLVNVGPLVGELLKAKLRRSGWRDPSQFAIAKDLDFLEQCRHEKFHKVFGLSFAAFERWISGHPRQPR